MVLVLVIVIGGVASGGLPPAPAPQDALSYWIPWDQNAICCKLTAYDGLG